MLQKDRVGLVQLEVQRVAVDLDRLAHRLRVLVHLRGGRCRPLDAEHHIVGGEGRAVVELDTFVQPDPPGQWPGLLPALGELRDQLQVVASAHQRLVHMVVDGVGQGFVLRVRVHGLRIALVGPAQGLCLCLHSGAGQGHEQQQTFEMGTHQQTP